MSQTSAPPEPGEPESWLAWVPWCPLDHGPTARRARPLSAESNADIMDVKQLARYLQVSPLSVYRALKTTDMPHAWIGGVIRFSCQAVESWIKGHD